MNPTWTYWRPARTSASTTSSESSAVPASGFSHNTGLPTAMQAFTSSAWVKSGEQMTTASTLRELMSDSADDATDAPADRATTRARSASASKTAETRAAGTLVSTVWTWSAPIVPVSYTHLTLPT